MNKTMFAAPRGANKARQRSWAAQMVHPLCDNGQSSPASFVSTEFTLAAVPRSARLFISAYGLYRCFINGKRVGEDVLTPGWTSYDVRLSYQEYEVADLLRSGSNRIEIWLADGWFRSQLMWGKDPIFDCWGKHLGAIAEIVAGEGEAPIVSTDASWRSGLLPIRCSGIYYGETYDAREETLTEIAGVEVLPFDKDVLIAHEAPPVRELAPFGVVEQWQDSQGRTTYDFGQNAAGYVHFRVRGRPGATVLVEHSEILDKDHQLANANYRTAQARIEYTLSGSGEEDYRPFFTFQGFRYARVTIEGDAEILSMELVPISSVDERTAAFSCGNPLVNRLVENTVWSQRSNFIDVPTDCPQRDERLGWSGDAQVFAGTACYLHDSHDFLVKYVRDLIADQRPNGAIAHFSPDPTRMNPKILSAAYGSTGWGDAICVIPWTLWLHYGDDAILRESIRPMEKWVDFVWSISEGPIVRPPRNWSRQGFSFGDWLQPKGPSVKPLPTIGDDAAATIYLYIAADLTAKAAEVVGERALAARMRALAIDVREAFQHEFITESGRLAYDDQTSYALAFLHDLIPSDKWEAAKGYFKAAIERCDGRIGTGFIGTPALLPALVKIGEPEWAGLMFTQEGVPGWLYQVKHGATTIWERWDAIQEDGTIFNPQMNSYNHYAYGAVCQWLFEAVAGFRPDAERAGFRKIIFEPAIIPELGPVSAHHLSGAGKVAASWQVDGDRVSYRVLVPQGAIGLVRLATHYGDVFLDGKPRKPEHAGEITEFEVGAGEHLVEFRILDLAEQVTDVERLRAVHQAMHLPD